MVVYLFLVKMTPFMHVEYTMTNPFLEHDLNIPASDLSWVKLYYEARAEASKKKAVEEKAKILTLRGGSSGCVTKEGNFIGTNPWSALSRFMGYQTPFLNSTLDIFDGGFKNEKDWETTLSEHPGAFQFTGDTAYPLVIKNFVKGYDLTGRPDGVALETIHKMDGGEITRSVIGVEHKGIFGSSSAEKCLNGKPKTDNLCQAATYMTGFGIPWSLVYTNHSNFKTYKKPAGPGRSEYHLGLIDGTLYFIWKGVLTETIIDVEGIREYYESIVEAYETRDHSWFRRESEDYLGEPEDYDTDTYNTDMLMFDRSGSFKDWEDQLKANDGNPHIIQFRQAKGQKFFQFWDTTGEGKLIREYDNLNDARNALRKSWGKK